MIGWTVIKAAAGQLWSHRPRSLWAILFVGCVLGWFYSDCRKDAEIKRQSQRVQELSQRLATSESTVEIERGLYAIRSAQVENLNQIVAAYEDELEGLKRQLDESGDRLAVANGLVVRWKKAYEGAVAASQTDVPGPDPDGDGPEPPVVRKRVDFSAEWGYIGVKGHTLTDPAEGFVSVEQLRPLKLVVGVARGTDGQWRTYVHSSEEGVAVDLDLSAVDERVMHDPVTWRDRLWIDGGVDLLGEQGLTLGASYRFDRFSVGVQCGAHDGTSCGVTWGYRPFK